MWSEDNCVDRHFQEDPDRVALIWEKDEPGTQEYVTYKDLYELMNRMANTLKSHGVRKGDRVIIYMPMAPMVVAAMLACARIGAVHSVVFAGFSSDALASRIQDAAAETVITTDQGIRGGKIIELKKVVDGAVTKCPTVKRVFVSKRTGAEVPMGKIDIPLQEELAQQPTDCPFEVMDSEDPLFLLYTSGSTGKPKGLVHTQAGYLLFSAFTHQTVFDYRRGDVFGCMADVGWITGHSYGVYGPLCNGATTVLFESVPTYPDPGRYWETVERLRITQFYGAPTALRLLLRYDNAYVRKYDRSSIKILGTVGEPINHEAWLWYYRIVGEERCPIVDTWWQSETGGILISPRPSEPDAEIHPAMPMRPMYGIDPVLLNDKGMLLIGREMFGSLCIRNLWPGVCRTIYNDHQRYVDTYFRPFPGYFFSGDGAQRIDGKFYKITGRTDDVINVSGHRLGTAEIEDILDQHQFVAESAVVGFPHRIKGEGIYAFVVLKENVPFGTAEQVGRELRTLVKEGIASYAVPELLQIVPGLPKTRSGKIMRRILRKIASNKPKELGDISTLADPSVVQALVKNHEDLVKTSPASKKD